MARKKYSINWENDEPVSFEVDGVSYESLDQVPDETDREKLSAMMDGSLDRQFEKEFKDFDKKFEKDWQEHKKTGDFAPLRRIAEYCAYDVKVTKCVHEYALEHGLLLYDDRNGQTARVEVDWK